MEKEKNTSPEVPTKEGQESEPEEKPVKKQPREELEKIPMQTLRGRVVILDAEKSEFAKNLKLTKRADYFKKKE